MILNIMIQKLMAHQVFRVAILQAQDKYQLQLCSKNN